MRPPIDFEHVRAVMVELRTWLYNVEHLGYEVPRAVAMFDFNNWLVLKIDDVEVWNQETDNIAALCFDDCRAAYMEYIASLAGLFAEHQAEKVGEAGRTGDDINQAIALLQTQLKAACAKSTTTWTLDIEANRATLLDGNGARWFDGEIAKHFKYFDELPVAQSPACAVPRNTLERVLTLCDLTDTDRRCIQTALNNK